MAATIWVAHDFTCPWCWIGWLQSRQLKREFGFEFDWVGFELWPEDLPRPGAAPRSEDPPDKPKIPSRLQLALAAQGIELPNVVRPRIARVDRALMVVEFARDHGAADPLVGLLYEAYWERGLDIGEHAALKAIARELGLDADAMIAAVEDGRYRSKVIKFDDEAHGRGIHNVPTFIIGGERLAEQPYAVLRAKALEHHPL